MDSNPKIVGACGENQARPAAETGAIVTSIARAKSDDAARNLGRNRRIEAGRTRFVATIDQSRLGAADRNEKDRSLCFSLVEGGDRI